MDRPPVSSPVVMIIFNRPDTTARVFAEVERARPSKLLVIADGPRSDRPEEAEKCSATRKIVEQVDWPCEVLTNFADYNMGCRQRVSSGLDWAFTIVEEAIILEDDCVPNATFFGYCAELLERYRNDTRIMMISGQNLQFGRQRGPYSYFFSRYCHIWGWATWRRAWRHYDINMKLWPQICEEGWLGLLLERKADVLHWRTTFEQMYRNPIDTWDVQWMFTCLIQRGLCVVPNVNMISNIGFGPAATHTTNAGSFLDSLHTQPMKFPLAHPPFVVRHRAADDYLEHTVYHLSPTHKIRRAIAKLARKIGNARR